MTKNVFANLKKPNVVATTAPQTEVKKAKVQVKLELDDIEEGLSIPTQSRGSIYDFKLEELNENQARFVALPEGISIDAFKTAVRQHIDTERRNRDYRQNFIMREVEKNGVAGVRIYCVDMEEKPMRGYKNKAQAA